VDDKTTTIRTRKLTIRDRFKSSIKRGTGEAHLILQKHPTIDFSSDILKASLRNYAYDGQAEGSRAIYISELIELSKQKDKILKAISNGLSNEGKDTWALVQLFDLAAIFAKQGDKELRKAIYKRFFKKKIEGSDWCGYDSIIDLDGLDGLKYIATTIGKSLEKKSDDWQDDMIINHFQDKFPKINAKRELEIASRDNKYIRIYLDNVKRTKKNRKKYKRPVFNLKTLREQIATSKYIYIRPSYTKSLSQAEIKIIANELLAEKDKVRLGKYLSIFSRIKFPYDYQPLLSLTNTKVNSKNRVAEWAVESLRFFSGKDIRQFALEKLTHTNTPWTYTNLLISNYKKGDNKLLTRLVGKCTTEDSIHNLVYSYVDIYKANKTRECKEPLQAIYDRLTCGIHRTDIVKIMMENNVLPKRIKAEIKFDSDEETRQLWTMKNGR
jgi:hypothetical protein